MEEDEERSEIAQWFAAIGFALSPAWREGEIVWVDLVKPSSGKVVWPRFGRGDTEIEALRSARRRYEEEQ